MSLQETALRLINEQGAALSLARNSGSLNRVTGLMSSSATQAIDTFAVEVSDERTITRAFGSISTADKVLMLHNGSSPMIGDKGTFEGQTLVVEQIKTIRKGSDVIYYLVRFSA